LIEEYEGISCYGAPYARLLPVSEAQVPLLRLQKCACLVSAEADVSNERLGKLIRNAEKDKIPVMGAKEVESNILVFAPELLENWERCL